MRAQKAPFFSRICALFGYNKLFSSPLKALQSKENTNLPQKYQILCVFQCSEKGQGATFWRPKRQGAISIFKVRA